MAFLNPGRPTNMSSPRSIAQSARFAFALEALPREVFDEIVRCLLGWDLFYLSHSSPWLLRTLGRIEIWENRVSRSHLTPVNAKREYVQTRSLRFEGQRVIPSERRSRGGGVKVDSRHLHRGVPGRIAFDCAPGHHEIPSSCLVKLSFDTWFSLLSPKDGILPGGILFGEQTEALTKRNRTPEKHVQFVQVDTERNLYCSLLDNSLLDDWSTKQPVATNLEYNRWYHLALSYDGSEERVFLDGDLMNTKVGWFIPWRRLGHAQIGSGYLSGQTIGSPAEDFNGWYGFHGVIQDFRFWNHTLTAEEVGTLVSGNALSTTTPSFSLLQVSKDRIIGSVKIIRSSPPLDRVFTRPKQRHNTSCTIS